MVGTIERSFQWQVVLDTAEVYEGPATNKVPSTSPAKAANQRAART